MGGLSVVEFALRLCFLPESPSAEGGEEGLRRRGGCVRLAPPSSFAAANAGAAAAGFVERLHELLLESGARRDGGDGDGEEAKAESAYRCVLPGAVDEVCDFLREFVDLFLVATSKPAAAAANAEEDDGAEEPSFFSCALREVIDEAPPGDSPRISSSDASQQTDSYSRPRKSFSPDRTAACKDFFAALDVGPGSRKVAVHLALRQRSATPLDGLGCYCLSFAFAGGGGAEKTLAGSVGARSIFRRCQSPRLSADEKEGNSEAASSEFSLFLASRLPTAASALQLLQPLHLKLEEGRCLYIELNALTAAVQTELKRLRRENQLATKTPTVRARLFAGEGAQRVALEARLEFKVFKQPPKTPGEKEAASGGGGEKTETQLSVKATLPSAPQGQQSASASERSSPFSGMPLVDDALGQPNSLSAASLQPKRRQWRLSVDCLSLRLFPADGDALPADRRALLRSVYVQCEYTPFAAEHKFTTATIDCSSEKAVSVREGFCSYTLAASEAQLSQSLGATPLRLCVFSRGGAESECGTQSQQQKEDEGEDEGGSRRNVSAAKRAFLLCEGAVDVGRLLRQPLVRDSCAPFAFQSVEGIAALYPPSAADAFLRVQGELHFQLHLEHLNKALRPPKEKAAALRPGAAFAVLPTFPENAERGPPLVDAAATAASLELWKATEQLKFHRSLLALPNASQQSHSHSQSVSASELQEKEALQQKKLEEDLRAQERLRSADVFARQQQLQSLQRQLREMASALQLKAVELHRKETELAMHQTQLAAVAADAEKQFAANAQQLQATSQTCVEIERAKQAQLRVLLEQSRAEAAAAVARAASAEAEAAAAKRHLFESPAVQLQAELQLKRFQVWDLTARLQATEASRAFLIKSCQGLIAQISSLRQQVTSAHLWGSDLHSQLRLVWAEVETLQRALTSLGLQQQPSQTQASTLPPTEMPTDPGRRPLHSQLGKRDAPAAVASADAADEESLSNNNPSSTGKGGGGDSRAMALQQEIDALLLTGVYSEEDALVQSLRRAKLEAENEAAASDELGG